MRELAIDLARRAGALLLEYHHGASEGQVFDTKSSPVDLVTAADVASDHLINEGLAAPIVPPETFARNLLKALHPGWGVLNEVIWRVMRLFGRLTGLDEAVAAFLEILKREAQYITTETLMTITLPPHDRLRLGDDLRSEFPTILQQIATLISRLS